MFDPEQKTTTPASSLSEDLVQFYNDFSEFNEYHAFYCEAFAGVVSVDELMDSSTVHGIYRCTRWIRLRMEEFKARLEVIERKSRTEEY